MDNSRIQVLICEDDKISMEINKRYVELFSETFQKEVQIHTIRQLDEQLGTLIKSGHIDIVLMDIDLEKANGVEIAEKLQQKNPDIPIIFITSHDEYLAKANKIMALGYIKKPIIQENFKILFERALVIAENNIEKLGKNFITVHSNKKEVSIRLSEIIYVEKVQRKIDIKTERGKFEINGTMQFYEEMLPSYFLRINQSVIVNMRKIISKDRNSIMLSTGDEFIIGKTYLKKVSSII